MSNPSAEMYKDTVYLDGVSLTAVVGPDCWGRPGKKQPVLLDIAMHTDIRLAGDTDDVLQSIHYGNLYKAVAKSVETDTFEDLDQLASAICATALTPELSGGNAAVELTITLPKGLLLAEGVGLRTGIRKAVFESGRVLFMKDIRLACIIGVNPPERLQKQIVVLNLEFSGFNDSLFKAYPEILKDVCEVGLSSLWCHGGLLAIG